MELRSLLLLGLAGLSVAAPAPHCRRYRQEDIESGLVLSNLSREAFDNAWARLDGKTEGCTQENVRIRKEWYDMTFFV